jgi:hypothetical protein
MVILWEMAVNFGVSGLKILSCQVIIGAALPAVVSLK